jgi:Cu2+-exporting ATPase
VSATAPTAETGLFLDGLRCAGCVNRVERVLESAPGVVAASVSFATHRALVRFDPGRTDVRALVSAVEDLGYTAIPYDPDALERPARTQAREAQVRLLVAAFLAGNVMLIALALYLADGGGMDLVTRRALRWLAIGLSAPSVFWCARPFWQGAWSGLRRGEIPFDVPVVLGLGVSFAGSIVATVTDTRHVFADSAAMIVFLVLLGRTLERSARGKATGAVERLVALLPAMARRVGADGIAEVPAASLVAGDIVVVAPGEAFPADGRVRAGVTEVDESLVSGESQTHVRGPGDAVIGASRNVLAEIRVELTAPARGGTLARIAALLERAQAERPQVQRIADRVAAVFAPTVLVAAACTALGHALLGASLLDASLAAASVLIVACPCALGLATPAAVAAALGRAANLGVLFKSGEALERCAGVQAVVLDKTGTLTEGRLALIETICASGSDEDELLATAASAEGASLHPLARAVVEAARSRGLALQELAPRRALPGRGVEAGTGADQVLVGAARLLEERGVVLPPDLTEASAKAAERGASVAFVARGARPLGVLVLADALREDAAGAVARLRRLGVEVSLLSGDQPCAVRLAAERTGIEDWCAAVSPEGKVDRVRARRREGRRVLVVGDGVNDAAALAAGDVGMAFARGADVALHAADAVIRSPRLGAVADALSLSRTMLRRIRENLGLALGYNAVAVPLAALGWLTPLTAAIAMSLSSLAVTGNALRLLRFRPQP